MSISVIVVSYPRMDLQKDWLARELDAAWAAGFFEGEGYIGLPNERRSGMRLSLTSTDLDVLRRFASVVGCGVVATKPSQIRHYKPAWRWELSYTPDVVRTLKRLSPYFGDRRKATAEVAMRMDRKHHTRRLTKAERRDIQTLGLELSSREVSQICRISRAHARTVIRHG